MARSNPPAPAIICAENVAALHVLHSRPSQRHAVPSQPSPNPITIDHQPRPADYTLPFEKERSLAGTLAFLAYAKEDNNYIPAVCIEENPIGMGLNILLAVNRGTENDGRGVLEELKQHFEEIFSILARMNCMRPESIYVFLCGLLIVYWARWNTPRREGCVQCYYIHVLEAHTSPSIPGTKSEDENEKLD